MWPRILTFASPSYRQGVQDHAHWDGLVYPANDDCLHDMVHFFVERLQATDIRSQVRGVGVKFVAGENIEMDGSGSVDLGFQSESDIMFYWERVREMGTLL